MRWGLPSTMKAQRSIFAPPAANTTAGGAGKGAVFGWEYWITIVNPDSSRGTAEPVVNSGLGPLSSIWMTGSIPGAARMMSDPRPERKSRV